MFLPIRIFSIPIAFEIRDRRLSIVDMLYLQEPYAEMTIVGVGHVDCRVQR
jgi:hypothetical protein